MNAEERKENIEKSQSPASSSPCDGAGVTPQLESPARESKLSGLVELVKDRACAPSLTRKSSGPKTPSEKERSKRNAIKHRIFSEVVLLRSESRSKFDAVLKGLMDQLQPAGKMEELLVDQLAAIAWRQRRLLVADTAGIEMAAFVVWDERERQNKEAWDSFRKPLDFADSNGEDKGLMQKIENPMVLERCLDLLNWLKLKIETHGFDPEFDQEILTKVYSRLEHWAETVPDKYEFWSNAAKYSDQGREQNGKVPAEVCIRSFLEALESEVKRLNRYKMVRASVESKKLKLEALRRYIPDADQLDRILRYEAALERAFDKTLVQLERLQRMRLGQAVLPPIKVSVTS